MLRGNWIFNSLFLTLHYQSLDDLFKVRIHRIEDDYSKVHKVKLDILMILLCF